jgi:hypothetical protein
MRNPPCSATALSTSLTPFSGSGLAWIIAGLDLLTTVLVAIVLSDDSYDGLPYPCS